MLRNKNTHTLLVGLWNSAAILEISLAIYQMLNMYLPRSCFPFYTLENLKAYFHMKTCTRIATLFTISKKVGIAQMPINGWMKIQNVVSSYKELLVDNKKIWNTDTSCNMDEL